MIKRTISTLALWAAVIAILTLLGPPGGILLLATIAVATQWEFYQLLRRAGQVCFPVLGCVGGGLLFLLPYFLQEHDALQLVGSNGQNILALFLILTALRSLTQKEDLRLPSFLGTGIGLLYIPFLLQYFVQIVLLPAEPSHGLFLAVWTIVVVKFTDVGAYLTGSLCGKHKMAPSLSPGKTWEGVIGGVLLSALLSFVLVAVFRDFFPPAFAPWVGALLALPLAALSVPSDLLESLFKRAAKAKDSGTFIPGIGGAYDLSDSLLLTAPVAFFLLAFFH